MTTSLGVNTLTKAYRITDHAAERYQERRRQPSLFMPTDICRARPVTKGRMRKIGRKTKSGQHMLLTPDNFAFVAAGKVIITCFQIRGRQ